jgi:uncharacterized protein YkvS
MKQAITLINQIDNMDDLNTIIGALKLKQQSLRAQLAAEARIKFSVGQTVNVITRKKGVLTGTIKKINRTNCVVNIKSSLYNVPMSIMEIA